MARLHNIAVSADDTTPHVGLRSYPEDAARERVWRARRALERTIDHAALEILRIRHADEHRALIDELHAE